MKHISEYRSYLYEYESDTIEATDAKAYPTILFTDVVGSSRLWSDDPEKMEKVLDEHFKIMSDIAEEHNGFIIKTIGDAFMIYFKTSKDSLISAIEAAIDMINKNDLSLRVGICYGPVKEKSYKLQGYNMKDFFGTTVNVASRMESKVSPKNGFAFAVLEPIPIQVSEEIKKIIDKMDVRKLMFAHECKPPEAARKKSERLLTDIQYYSCESIEKLNGIDDITVFRCEP